ncbi:MAG: hypothetical protein HRT47_08790 [Candidatus Caenarcaniphilales bacterium]|nr:hypothetical protein [Candidatus Caenarcaniphilales bacterium]
MKLNSQNQINNPYISGGKRKVDECNYGNPKVTFIVEDKEDELKIGPKRFLGMGWGMNKNNPLSEMRRIQGIAWGLVDSINDSDGSDVKLLSSTIRNNDLGNRALVSANGRFSTAYGPMRFQISLLKKQIPSFEELKKVDPNLHDLNYQTHLEWIKDAENQYKNNFGLNETEPIMTLQNETTGELASFPMTELNSDQCQETIRLGLEFFQSIEALAFKEADSNKSSFFANIFDKAAEYGFTKPNDVSLLVEDTFFVKESLV